MHILPIEVGESPSGIHRATQFRAMDIERSGIAIGEVNKLIGGDEARKTVVAVILG